MILLLEYTNVETNKVEFIKQYNFDIRLHLKDAKELVSKLEKFALMGKPYKLKLLGEVIPVDESAFAKQYSPNLLVQFIYIDGEKGSIQECNVKESCYLPEAQRAVNAQYATFNGSMSILGEVVPVLSYQKQRVVDAYKKLGYE